MNQRERMLLLAFVGTPILLGLLFLGYVHVAVKPDYDGKIEELEAQADRKKRDVFKIARDQKVLERWRHLSLPTKQQVAQVEYGRFLQDLLRGKFADLSLQPNTPMEVKTGTGLSKKTIYTALPFSVNGKATLAQLVQVVEKFQRTPLMHKLKTLTVKRDAGDDERGQLTVQLVAEALILDGAANVPHVVAGIDPRLAVLDAIAGMTRNPVGLAVVPWIVSPRGPTAHLASASRQRKYTDIATRNIFTGAPAPRPVVAEPPDEFDVTAFVQLGEISPDEDRPEAFLHNRITARSQRLLMSPGYNTFQFTNESGSKLLVRGMVLRIEPRDLFFATDDGVYAMHIGQTLADALRRPLDEAEIQLLGLDVGSP